MPPIFVLVEVFDLSLRTTNQKEKSLKTHNIVSNACIESSRTFRDNRTKDGFLVVSIN